MGGSGSSLVMKSRTGSGGISVRTGSSGSLSSSADPWAVPNKLLEALHEEFGEHFEQDVLWRSPLGDLPFHRYDHIVVFRGDFMGPRRDHVRVVELLAEKMATLGQGNVMFLVFPSLSMFTEVSMRTELPVTSHQHQLLLRWMVDTRLLMTGLAFSRPDVKHTYVCSDDYDAIADWDRVYREVSRVVVESVGSMATTSRTMPRVHYMFGIDSIDGVIETLQTQRKTQATKSPWPLICCTRDPPNEEQVTKIAKLNDVAAFAKVYAFPSLDGRTGSDLRRAVVNSTVSDDWKDMLVPCLVPAMEKVLADKIPLSAPTSYRGSPSRSGSPARFTNEH